MLPARRNTASAHHSIACSKNLKAAAFNFQRSRDLNSNIWLRAMGGYISGLLQSVHDCHSNMRNIYASCAELRLAQQPECFWRSSAKYRCTGITVVSLPFGDLLRDCMYDSMRESAQSGPHNQGFIKGIQQVLSALVMTWIFARLGSRN